MATGWVGLAGSVFATGLSRVSGGSGYGHAQGNNIRLVDIWGRGGGVLTVRFLREPWAVRPVIDALPDGCLLLSMGEGSPRW